MELSALTFQTKDDFEVVAKLFLCFEGSGLRTGCTGMQIPSWLTTPMRRQPTVVAQSGDCYSNTFAHLQIDLENSDILGKNYNGYVL